VIEAYGGKCSCCGIADRTFLTLDHIDGGGRKHRQQVSDVYVDVERQGFPDSMQVLCSNCHLAKDTRGGCPHIEEEEYFGELFGLLEKRVRRKIDRK